MGAYEYQYVASDVVYCDCDGDSDVDSEDLFAVLGNWGVTDGCCLADVDANGVVDVFDLFDILNNWGTCP